MNRTIWATVRRLYGDSEVDAADYVVWRENLDTGAILPNDITPGVVDATDYGVWW